MWTEEKLDAMLTTPSDRLVADMAKVDGDLMVLGAGGKMGPTLCLLAQNAFRKAGKQSKVIAVSRFSDPIATKLLQDNGVELISADLLDVEKLHSLPVVENVIYMAGRKFGTNGSEALTWAMNATLPAFVAEHFKKSNIVVFSSGNIYGETPLTGGGNVEEDPLQPVGEYAMSCLARERAFEYGALAYGTKALLYRLNYSLDLRYGVLYDMADRILKGEPISLKFPCVNFIWQGDANEMALRCLLHTGNPIVRMNITGPETVSVRYAATRLGKLLGKEPIFAGEEGDSALLNNAGKAMTVFGYPSVSAETLIDWQAQWLLAGGRSLGKPTHFEETKGKF